MHMHELVLIDLARAHSDCSWPRLTHLSVSGYLVCLLVTSCCLIVTELHSLHHYVLSYLVVAVIPLHLAFR